MKKLVLSIVIICSVNLVFGQAYFHTIDSLRNFTNRYIKNSAIEAFTNLRLNTSLNGIIQFLDSARLVWGGNGGVDTLNDGDVDFTKTGGQINNVIIKLRGRNVASTAPTDGQALVWDNAGNTWKPGTVSGGGSSLTATRIGFGDGSNNLTGDASYTWDNTNKLIKFGSDSLGQSLWQVKGSTASNLPSTIEFTRNFGGTAAAARMWVGMIGSGAEINPWSYNMSYYKTGATNEHHYGYDPTSPAVWAYVDANGMGIQAVDAGYSDATDIWIAGGSQIPYKIDFMRDGLNEYHTGMNKIHTAQLNFYDQTTGGYPQTGQLFVSSGVGQVTGIKQWQYENAENNANIWQILYRKNKAGSWNLGSGQKVVEFNYNGGMATEDYRATADVTGGFSTLRKTLAFANAAGTFTDRFVFWPEGHFEILTGQMYLGQLSADPGTTQNGALYYNTTTNKFRARQNSAWTDMIGAGGGSTTFEQAITNGNLLTADRTIENAGFQLTFNSASGITKLGMTNPNASANYNNIDYRRTISGSYNLSQGVYIVKHDMNTLTQFGGVSTANTTAGLSTIDFFVDAYNAAGSQRRILTMEAEGNLITPAGGHMQAASSYHNWGTTYGTSGYGFRDNGGTMEFKNSGGSWAAFGTGSGGITGTLTAGRVPYASGTSTLADNANFLWDNTNQRLSVATTSASANINIGGSRNWNGATSGVQALFTSGTYTDNTTATSGTESAAFSAVLMSSPTLAASNTGVTASNAYTLFIDKPIAGTNITITKLRALYANGPAEFASGVYYKTNGASDANYTVTADDYYVNLPTITAGRTITLPATAQTGRVLIFKNKNSSGNTWQFGTAAKDGADASVTNLVNDTIYVLLFDGTDWQIIN